KEIRAMDMEEYYRKLKETSLEGFKRINETEQVEDKNLKFPAGSLDISVVRGTVLEKAATSRIRLKTKNPATGEDTQFDIFQIKTYPASPKIPIILFNMENRAAKEDRFGGFLDVAPVAANREDLNLLNDKIKRITRKHGAEYEPLRKKLVDVYKMDHWKKAVNAAIGIRLDLAGGQFDLVKEAALKWLEYYFTIVEQRANEHYDKEDEMLMYSVRARIMEFYIIKDMSFKIIQKLGIPVEMMALIHFAPTIKY
ncbi:MAG: coproporphyrinogen III oxidase, partial [Deltaproteobacteria bacterium]|nr:coproporphyrinogen III oxidase [Deltaproteobacteria bacterium]